ncbi:DUF1254 domain-containing protein [Herbiconiux moechotypicola]|uniref:DUF1254 domain-containing protein n=1 Tax=Herbiconiux moechotypicola TaxID=637393 RepID=A0ABN3DYH9_9MICO|nr:DUF1254 domain-containing protein [Herbiconiux moechotypicola]MCS5731241.1 DUF1254 domain-containing protein [Herbiconiux moechotypicola]
MTISDDLARDAYLYAYSIDEAYKFLYETTIAPGGALNRFQKLRDLADDTYTAHPTINNDTLHLQGWFDVAAEPVVVTIPDADEGRYWILHTMDMGHYTNAMIGSRTRGTRGGTFLFAARAWDGDVPDGVDEVIRSESNLIKVMGRIMTVGGDDLEVARALQDRWRLETLSQHLGTPTPPATQREFPDPASTDWLERVAFSLADGSMAVADVEWLGRYAAIGLEPGRTEFTAEQLEAAARGEELGMKHLEELAPTLTNAGELLGTREELQHGARDLFAAGTFLGQWGLPPVESVYVKIDTGSDGLILNGSGGKEYRARFSAPEVSEFWSFTAYAYGNRLMAHNALNRHSRGDRTLTPDADGRYTLLLSSDVNAHAADGNLLPIPEENTYLVLRLYGPSEAMQRGDYTSPVFEIVKNP